MNRCMKVSYDNHVSGPWTSKASVQIDEYVCKLYSFMTIELKSDLMLIFATTLRCVFDV